jgi:hypothetical protein
MQYACERCEVGTKICIGIVDRKGPLAKPRLSWNDDIKIIYLRCSEGVDWIHPPRGQTAGLSPIKSLTN